MKIKARIFSLSLILALSILNAGNLFGQKTKTKSTSVTNKEKDNRSKTSRSRSGSIIKRRSNTYWIIGIGGNVVDDDGSPFKKLFGAPLRWNVRPYPTRLTVERSLKGSFSIEGAFNYNTYRRGKIINNDQTHAAGIFLSGDLNFKNDFNRMFKFESRFNPYMIYGVGTTFRTIRTMPIGANFNFGFGFNIWLSKVFGFNFQSIAKFGVGRRFPRASSNYLQHSMGVVIKLQKGGKRPFSKRRYKWIHRNNIGRERT